MTKAEPSDAFWERYGDDRRTEMRERDRVVVWLRERARASRSSQKRRILLEAARDLEATEGEPLQKAREATAL